MSAIEIDTQGDLVEIYDRVKILMKQSGPNVLPKKEDLLAVLGGVHKPSKGKVKGPSAFGLYFNKISSNDQYN